LQLIFRKLCVAGGVLLVACDGSPPSPPEDSAAGVSGSCGPQSYVRAELYGAVRGALVWSADLACEGMPRPGGQGARLRLSGPAPADGAQQLALILGLPDLERGATGREIQTNVTLIAEEQGLFFSTTDAANCWTDITEQAALEGDADTYRVTGVLYCVAPLPEVNGNKNITLGDLEFSSTLNWKLPE